MPDNLYKRGKTYYARVQVAGVDVRRSLKTGNAAEANRRLKVMLKEVSPYYTTVRKTVADVIDSALDVAPVKPKTLDRYVQSGLILARHFEGKYFDQVDKKAVLKFITARKQEGVSIRTIKNDLSVLSIAAEHGIDQDWVGTNPVTLIPKHSLRHKPPIFVLPPQPDIELVLSCVHGPLGDYCRFLRHTGMRRDEAATLAWSQVDLERKAATLSETKSGRARTVSLNDAALEMLKSRPSRAGLVFTRKDGKPYTSISQSWREARNRAMKKNPKCQRFRLHDLRHIYAIEYLRGGGNLYALQKQLGHGSIRQTEDYLAYLTPEEQEIAKSGSAQKPAQMHRFALADGEEID